MAIDVRDSRALALLDEAAELETLGLGFTFTEGPVWAPAGAGHLLFTDVPVSRRWRWDERDGCRLLAEETALGDGMTFDLAGRLLVCEGARGQLARMDADGSGAGAETVTGHYQGRRFNSPNDVIVRADGTIYFTDPWWPNRFGWSLERELDFQGVYRLAPGGEPEPILRDMDFPNGLCLSPDERLLYVNDSTPGRIVVLDVAADGRTSGARILLDGARDPSGHPDGMKCDVDGNIWVTGPGGVWVLDPAGALLAVVPTPERTGNIHWGGPDWSWLLVCASTGLYRLRTRTSGRREPFMRAV